MIGNPLAKVIVIWEYHIRS